jgi:pimeloyl-ACP methyl ester carboxylesterase
LTAATVAPPRARPSLLSRLAGAARARSTEALVFSGATAVALLHALDDAFLLPGPGVPLGQHALAAAIAVVASVAAVLAFPRLRPGLQSATAFTFGVLAAINGGRHVHHMLNVTTTANDVTGALALLAGVVLVGLAAWIPFRRRGEGVAHPLGRWVVRVIVLAGLVLSVPLFWGPVGMAVVDSHSLSKPLGDPPNAAYETVRLTTSDGLELEGWYRPSRNGAAVLLGSGGGSTRMSTLRHATMLERHGYGVLVYDPRGMGHSEGTPNSYAWGWEKDVDAALEYLGKRDDVEPGRIGALGLSSGADAVLDAAGRRSDLAAVVADGTAAIGYEDIKAYSDDALTRAPMWVLFKTIEVLKGRSGPDVSLADRIERSRTPHLLVAAGKPEKEWGELYDRRGGDRSELWYLPKASHTAALKQYPEEYERRVTAFFADHMGR